VREEGEAGKPETDKYSLVVTAVIIDNRIAGRKTDDIPIDLTAGEFDELQMRIAGHFGKKVASR
jgi:hypothetical protein